MLDVGQGDSIYIKLPHNTDILIDTGPDDRVLAQLGQHMPFNDNTIELLIFSHFHSDHIGGFPAINQRYNILQIWLAPTSVDTAMAQQVKQIITDTKIPTREIEAGDVLTEKQFRLVALHPPPIHPLPNAKADAHDTTIVLKFSYGSICAIFTGDINEKHEAYILEGAQQLSESLRCPILKVSHHGSGTGSSGSFLAAVYPEIAIISVGLKNRYNHPHPVTLSRLNYIGAKIFRTDQNGTVTIESDGQHYWTKTEK